MMKYLSRSKFVILLFLLSLLSCRSNAQNKTTQVNEARDQPATPNRKSFGMDKSGDSVLKRLQTETLDKFVQLQFKDSVTLKEMSYSLFVPKGYDKNRSYPLVLFIADASTVGKEAEAPLTQGYGGLVWATAESQSENPAFILVPNYITQTVNDKFETSCEVEMTIRLLHFITEKYRIDKNP